MDLALPKRCRASSLSVAAWVEGLPPALTWLADLKHHSFWSVSVQDLAAMQQDAQPSLQYCQVKEKEVENQKGWRLGKVNAREGQH